MTLTTMTVGHVKSISIKRNGTRVRVPCILHTFRNMTEKPLADFKLDGGGKGYVLIQIKRTFI